MIEIKKNHNNVRVTFILPKDESYGNVSVVGDFNDWKPGKTPLIDDKDDSIRATIRLKIGEKYAFRYLSEGCSWFNDTSTADFERSPFNSTNCVLQT